MKLIIADPKKKIQLKKQCKKLIQLLESQDANKEGPYYFWSIDSKMSPWMVKSMDNKVYILFKINTILQMH